MIKNNIIDFSERLKQKNKSNKENIIKETKIKEFNSVVCYDWFDGYNNEQELLKIMVKKKFPDITDYKVIKFNGMYYAVAMENYGRKIVIGRDTMWYVTGEKLEHRRTSKITLVSQFKEPMMYFRPYNVQSLGIINDLFKKDKDAEEYDVIIDSSQISGYSISKSYSIYNCFLNALGLAFVSPKYFIKKEQISLLNDYFMAEYLTSFADILSGRTYKCINSSKSKPYNMPLITYAINPFYSTVILGSEEFPKDKKYKIKGFFYGIKNTPYGERMNPHDISINMYYNSDIKDIFEIEELINNIK